LALGSLVVFDKPELTLINREEIKIHITNINRFGGAVVVKLLDHECLCVLLAQEYKQFNRFLDTESYILQDHDIQTGYVSIHDDHESVVGDIPSGFKKHLPDFKRIEHAWETHFHNQQGMPLTYRNDKFVKALDVASLACEMRMARHPSGPIAVEKYKLQDLWQPSMDKLAGTVLYELTVSSKLAILDEAYIVGKTRLAEMLGRLDEYDKAHRGPSN